MSDANLLPRTTAALTPSAIGRAAAIGAATLLSMGMVLPINKLLSGLRFVWIMFAVWAVLASLVQPVGFSRVLAALRRRAFELVGLVVWSAICALNWFQDRGPGAEFHLIIAVSYLQLVLLTVVAGINGTLSSIRNLTLWAAFFFLAVSIPSLFDAPFLARSNPDAEDVASLSLRGVGDYAFYAGAALTTPWLVARGVTLTGARRLVSLAALAVVLAAILLSMYTAATLFSTIGAALMAGLAWVATRKRSAAGLMVGLAVVAIVGLGTSAMQESTHLDYLTEKLTLQVTVVEHGTSTMGNIAGREGVYETSWHTFQSSPFLGIGPVTGKESAALWRDVGGHSSWLDMLAEYGVLGFAPYLVFIVGIGLRAFRRIRQFGFSPETVAPALTFALFVLMGGVNPVANVTATMWMLLLLAAWNPVDETA
jgi:O-antigen ligase